MPSTIANVIDLLQSWKRTTSRNENISALYIFYQGAILVASLLSPGIIFMMMVGAVHASIKNWDSNFSLLTSAILNIIPVGIFVVLCFKASSKVQLWFAWICTGIYIAVQFIVLVGTLVTMSENYICHSTTVFFLGVAGVFLLAAILHPQEFGCIFKGLVYYFSIPTMYMILMIYAICNLHVVSWGTRETKLTAAEKAAQEASLDAADAKKRELEAQKNKKSAAAIANNAMVTAITDKASMFIKDDACKCGSLCNILCCSKPVEIKSHDEEIKLINNQIKSLEQSIGAIGAKLDVRVGGAGAHRSLSPVRSVPLPVERKSSIMDPIFEDNEANMDPELVPLITTNDIAGIESSRSITPQRDELKNPSWMDDDILKDGARRTMDPNEVKFFQDLIAKYLYPLIKDRETEAKYAQELMDLRNRCAAAMIFFNCVFIVGTFFLQFNVKTVYIYWPCPDKTIPGSTSSGVDPLGFIFLVLFGTVIIIQALAMLVHRMTTFMHIMATTSLTSASGSDASSQIKDARVLVQLAKDLSRLDIDEPEADPGQNNERDESDSDEESDESKSLIKKQQGNLAKTIRLRQENLRRKRLISMAQEIGADQLPPEARRPGLTVNQQFRKRFAIIEKHLNQTGPQLPPQLSKINNLALKTLRGHRTVRQREVTAAEEYPNVPPTFPKPPTLHRPPMDGKLTTRNSYM